LHRVNSLPLVAARDSSQFSQLPPMKQAHRRAAKRVRAVDERSTVKPCPTGTELACSERSQDTMPKRIRTSHRTHACTCLCGRTTPLSGRLTRRRTLNHDKPLFAWPVRWSGSGAALLSPRPPRTVRETFASYGSSIGQRTFSKHAVAPWALGPTWTVRRPCRLPR
jgi:hypothetical protein